MRVCLYLSITNSLASIAFRWVCKANKIWNGRLVLQWRASHLGLLVEAASIYRDAFAETAGVPYLLTVG